MDLWDQLHLDMAEHRVIALVGGGGKTTTLFALARQARDAGRTVIVTTTTHMMPHPALFLTDDPSTDYLKRCLQTYGILTLGRFQKKDKLSGAGDVALCKAVADITVVEADGARVRPLKAPSDHEPVIPACADAVIAVAGMDSVGAPIKAVCHRPDRVCALLGRPMDWSITPQDVAKILSSPAGGRKAVGDRAFRCVLNKADTPVRLQYAQDISILLKQKGITSAITKYSLEERGGKCWFL